MAYRAGMTITEVRDILKHVSFPGYTFVAAHNASGRYLQASYMEADIISGKMVEQKTRKWQLSEHMVKSEIVQTAFKCILTSAEHTVREHFKYRDERVYGPHFDVEALVDLCRAKKLDYRGRK